MGRISEAGKIMNDGIKQQILNMTLMANNFKMGCHYAAKKDDGEIDPAERKILNRIDRTTEKFLRELERIKNL